MKTTNVRASASLNRSHVRFALVAVVCVANFVACGGSDDSLSGLACGAGTHEAEGTCVSDGAAGAGGSSAGTSGAAGQAAGAAGMAGTAGAATAAGAGGAAGGAATGGVGGTGGSSTGGASGGSAGASGAGAAGWGDPHPGDDPCPPKIDINCSDSCGPMHPSCKDPGVTCPLTAHIKLPFITKPVGQPDPQTIVVRTPSHPGMDPKCPDCLSLGPRAYAFGTVIPKELVLDFQPRTLRFEVRKDPWAASLGTNGDSNGTCHDPSKGPSCYTIPLEIDSTSPPYAIDFLTNAPDAPARNFTIQVSFQKLSCP